MHKRLMFLCLLLPGTSMCQLSSVMYPDFSTSYQVNMAWVNAAYIPKNAVADFTSCYRFQTGAFRQISTLSFSGGKIFRKDKGPSKALRLVLSSEKQGPFISTPRGYVNYAYELPLSDDISVSAGVSVGIIQKYYSGTVATGNTNAILPDASVGLVFRFRMLELGASSLQVLNSRTRSLSSDLEFKRHYQFFLHYQFRLSERLEMRTNVLWRLLPLVKDEGVAGLSIIFDEKVSLGLAGRTNFEASFYSRFNLDSGNDILNLTFVYNTPFFSPYTYAKSTIEIGLGYSLF